jgi:hypothetical protein
MTCVAGYCTASRACVGERSDAQTGETSDGTSDLVSDAALDGASDLVSDDAFDGPSDLVGDVPVVSFVPTDLDSLVLWLDPADIRTVPFQWRDRSSAHNNAVPGAAPFDLEAPWPGLPPALRFASSDQYLVLPSGMSDFTAGLSLFVVAEPNVRLSENMSSAMRFIDFAATAGSQNDSIIFCRYEVDGSALLYQVYVGSDPKQKKSAPEAVGNFSRQLFEVVATGGDAGTASTMRYFKNGSGLATGPAQVPRVLTRTSNLIGRSNFRDDGGADPDPTYRGLLGEIILYNRALSDDERRSVEAYLLTRWRLP